MKYRHDMTMYNARMWKHRKEGDRKVAVDLRGQLLVWGSGVSTLKPLYAIRIKSFKKTGE